MHCHRSPYTCCKVWKLCFVGKFVIMTPGTTRCTAEPFPYKWWSPGNLIWALTVFPGQRNNSIRYLQYDWGGRFYLLQESFQSSLKFGQFSYAVRKYKLPSDSICYHMQIPAHFKVEELPLSYYVTYGSLSSTVYSNTYSTQKPICCFIGLSTFTELFLRRKVLFGLRDEMEFLDKRLERYLLKVTDSWKCCKFKKIVSGANLWNLS